MGVVSTENEQILSPDYSSSFHVSMMSGDLRVLGDWIQTF